MHKARSKYIWININLKQEVSNNMSYDEGYNEERDYEEDDIYDDEFVEELREDDEISDVEEAFMKGYNEEEE